MSNDQYDQLSLDCINDWLCPACVSDELPFANSSASCLSEELSFAEESLTTDTFRPSPLDISKTSSPLDSCTNRVVFCHLNAQCLRNKMDELRSILTNAKRPAIFGISETWLESDVPDGEVAIPSYKLFRRDRKSRGGGVLLYVPERCKSKRRLDLEDDEIECVWVEVRLNKMTILLGNMYRPPNADLSVFSNFEVMMERVAAECRDVVLMGDLNINLLTPSSQTDRLLLITSENNLKQLISEPTRITDHSQTLLDVLFTSSPDVFSSSGATECVGSDHLMIFGEHKEEVKLPAKVCTVRSFKKCEEKALLSDLGSAPWQVMDSFDDVNDKLSYWMTLFLSVVDKHAPLMKVRMKTKNQDDDWIDSGLRSLMRSRNYYRKKHRKTRAEQDWHKFKAIRNEVNRRLRVAKSEYFRRVCKDISHQPRFTWRQLNTALGRKVNGAIDAINWGGRVLAQPSDIANGFVQHFSSSKQSSSTNLECHVQPILSKFSFIPVSEEDVLKKLSQLDERKATGPDSLSAKLLRMVAPAISNSLTSILNASLSQGHFPTEWKEANVTPVPKSGDRNEVNNYRPVSVIPVLAKVFECIVYDQLFEYVEKNRILNEEQAGFRPNRSTQDVLLRATDDWKKALDLGQIVATVMIDLSKAFDTINHDLLLRKLNAYGIQNAELAWFTDYLSGRKQRVVLNSVPSEWARVTMGVPQGSILGPLLFLLFVNDLPDVVQETSINLFADDTAIYSADSDPSVLGERVEKDLGRVALWIHSNGLRLNVAKTQLMVLSRRGRREEADSVRVKIGEVELQQQSCVRYLGVEIDRDLTWKAHIQKVYNQCMGKLAAIRRAGSYLPCHIRKLLYQAFVLPHLDYCSVVWNSCGATLGKRIERVQNYALR